MNINLDNFKNDLTPSEIIMIIRYFFPNIDYEETNTFLLFPTICHNLTEDCAKKLYYYFNTKLFFCYTECNDSFDIYELVAKILRNKNEDDKFSHVFSIILKATNKETGFSSSFPNQEKYTSILDKFKKPKQDINFKIYDKKILRFFKEAYYAGWIQEGMKIESLHKYGIRFSPDKNQIIIPHYDINDNLIGIRSRNLDIIDILNGNKYMPTKIEGKYYNHQLSYNLYGLNFNKEQIKKTKTAMIFEGEKSVILCDSWYGENNIAVATCGNKINKIQINLLIKLGVQNIILCYDRMNQEKDDKYFYQLYERCEKYKDYLNFSFIYDRKQILDYKAAPVDSGKEVFEKLLKERVFLT